MPIIRKLALSTALLLVFAIPTDGMFTPAGLSLVKVAGLLLAGFVVLLWIAGQSLQISQDFLIAVLLFSCWALLTYLWTSMPVNYNTPNAINSQQSLKAYLYLLVLIFLLFQVIDDEKKLQWFCFAWLLGSFFLITFLLFSYNPTATTVRHGIKGFDANETALQIAIGIPIAAYLFTYSYYFAGRILILAYLPLAIFAILITGSRTGFITLIISVSSLIPWFFRSKLIIKFISLVALISALVFVLANTPPKTLERVFNTGAELSQGTLSERSVTWSRAWDEWTQAPVIGNGLGSFRRVINKYNIDYTAHNSYIAIAVEQGIVGLVFYLLVIIMAFLLALRLQGQQRFIAISLLLVASLGQMTLTLHEKMYIWLCYAFPALLFNMKNNNVNYMYLKPSGKSWLKSQ